MTATCPPSDRPKQSNTSTKLKQDKITETYLPHAKPEYSLVLAGEMLPHNDER